MILATGVTRALIAVWLLSLASAATAGAPRIERVAGMEFVEIPAGRFVMGSPRDELGREKQEVAHSVVISKPFFLGRYEVTQEQWERIMGSNPAHFSDCALCPVERVSFEDVRLFIERVGKATGRAFRLPTEAEWEYACRAGTATPFNTGETLTTGQANFDGRYPYGGDEPGVYRERTTPAGTFAPNAWGLFDMHGNVWEWTEDWHCDYPDGEAVDPVGKCDSALKVIRGGSWYFDANSSRCALRYTHRPKDLGFSIGFRLVLEEE